LLFRWLSQLPGIGEATPLSKLASALEALRQYFGFAEFREGQAEVIDSVLSGHDSVVVMPTGGGKSLCYQLPAMMLDGATLVVSPLIALMKDQVDQLVARGLPSTFINSSLSYGETNRRLSEIRRGLYKLVYVAPERFRSRAFVDSIGAVNIRLLAVDEAHCISHWGHDFRPDYLRLGEAGALLGRPQIIALTATATPKVRSDISEQLGLKEPRFFTAGFDRPNLHMSVLQVTSEKQKLDTLKQVFVTSRGSGIIYAATRKSVEQVTARLKMSGLRAEAYHAGMTEAERSRAQDAFMQGRVQAIVATNAFGMGIDKPDTRFVIHYHLPGSIEAYYQEIGRAGRDGLASDCILLFNYADTRTHQFFIEGNHPPPELISQIYFELASHGVENLEITPREIAQSIGIKNEMSVQSALVILEKAGHIERGRNADASLYAWLKTRLEAALDAVPDDTTEAAVLRELIYAHDLNEQEHVRVDVVAVAQSLKLKDWQVRRALDQLSSREIMAYRKAYQGRGIRLLDKEPVTAVRINARDLAARAAAEQWKLRRMIDYCYHRKCLRRFVLDYFGDRKKIDECGTCSNCAPRAVAIPAIQSSRQTRRAASGTLRVPAEAQGRAPAMPQASRLDGFIIDNAPAGVELRERLKSRAAIDRAMNTDSNTGQPAEPSGRTLNEAETLAVRKILSCVARMNGRFGKGTVAAVLRGSKSKQVLDNHLEKLTTYGLLQEMPQEELMSYIKALMQARCIESGKGLYPTVSLTEFGREVMLERAAVRLQLPK
jgi:ATP-dependent DNA helicase RecQ